MEPTHLTTTQMGLLAVFAFKVLSLLVGMLCIWLGYRLFVKGYFDSAGDFAGKFGTHQVTLKKGAPGSFFALFGALIIGVAVVKGFAVDYNQQAADPESPRPPAAVVLPDSLAHQAAAAGSVAAEEFFGKVSLKVRSTAPKPKGPGKARQNVEGTGQ